jgi:hypothetical protein
MKPTINRVVINIQSFNQSGKVGEDILEFTDEGLDALKEIDEDPKKAVFIALQIAVKMKRFDTDSRGSFTLQSQRMKGKFEVPEWR